MKLARTKRWVLLLLAAIALSFVTLASIDQWQGGPLGRTYYIPHSQSGNMVGITTVGGNRIWFGGDLLFNSTPFPYQILSVQPINSPSGISIKGGITMNTSGGVQLLGDANLNKYGFVSFPVKIPPGENEQSRNRYFTSLVVTANRPGTYRVNGLLVRYHWGPFTYTAKMRSMIFTIAVKDNS